MRQDSDVLHVLSRLRQCGGGGGDDEGDVLCLSPTHYSGSVPHRQKKNSLEEEILTTTGKTEEN